jgi:hypothetical protein
MSPDLWLALAALVLLLAGAIVRCLALLGPGLGLRRWPLLGLGLRAAAVLALLVALGLELATNTMAVPLALALAALLFHFGLWRYHRFDGSGPAIDLAALALVVVGLVGSPAAGQGLVCAQRALVARAQDILFLIGAGGATVMGSSGLVLAIRGRWQGALLLPGQADLSAFLQTATAWTLFLLGGGLLVGFWWLWRALGRLVGDDLRTGWLAAAWLLAAGSWLAWRLASRRGGWAVAFALLAAVAADLGLVAATQVPHWFGF